MTIIKSLPLPLEDALKVAKAALECWDIKTSFQGDGQVLIKEKDLARLVTNVFVQHAQLDLIRQQLAMVFPVIGIDRMMGEVCKSFHNDWPLTPEASKVIEEANTKAIERLRADLSAEAMLNHVDPANFQKE